MIARSQKFSMQGRTVLVIGAGGYSKCFIWDTYQTFGIQVHKLPSTLPEYLQIFRFHFYFKINEKHNIPHCWNSSLIQSKNIRNRIKLITHDHSMS
jgi:shikimate 5-dehydrogenase